MSAADEEWVKSAMTNDNMVVELLVQLHSTSPAPLRRKPATLPLEWSIRQRRSKSISINNKLKNPAHQASPTTPLSWSGGATSVSGGPGGGNEESSGPHPLKLSSSTRSKDNGDSGRTASKKSRKKKTLPELKEEENMLMRERRELKRELTALRLNLEEQRVTNQRFKRLKLELQPPPHLDTTSLKKEIRVSEKLEQKSDDDDDLTRLLQTTHPILNGCIKQNGGDESVAPASCRPTFVLLPDLNMPFNDDPTSSEVICGVN